MSEHNKQFYRNCTKYFEFLRKKGVVDYDFEDENEEYYVGDGFEVYSMTRSISVTVPENANLGNTRMRIMASHKPYDSHPCGLGGVGEVEDYSIKIILWIYEEQEFADYQDPVGKI